MATLTLTSQLQLERFRIVGEQEEVVVLVEGFADVLDGSVGHEWSEVDVGEDLAIAAINDEDAAVGAVEGAGFFVGRLGDLFGSVTVDVKNTAVGDDGAAVDTFELEVRLPSGLAVGGVDGTQNDLALFEFAMMDEEGVAVGALDFRCELAAELGAVERASFGELPGDEHAVEIVVAEEGVAEDEWCAPEMERAGIDSDDAFTGRGVEYLKADELVGGLGD